MNAENYETPSLQVTDFVFGFCASILAFVLILIPLAIIPSDLFLGDGAAPDGVVDIFWPVVYILTASLVVFGTLAQVPLLISLGRGQLGFLRAKLVFLGIGVPIFNSLIFLGMAVFVADYISELFGSMLLVLPKVQNIPNGIFVLYALMLLMIILELPLLRRVVLRFREMN